MERKHLIKKPIKRKHLIHRIKITKAFVDHQPLSEEGQRYFFDSDLRGFGLRVGKTKKSYFAERMIKGTGRSPRITIGPHGIFTAEEARDRARRLLGQMADGIDPVEERDRKHAEKRAEERGRVALKDVWDEFKTARALKPSTLRGYKNILDDVFTKWLDRPVQSISRDEVAVLHSKLSKQPARSGIGIDKPKTAYADGSMRFLSSVMSFAKGRNYTSSNPVEVIGDLKTWHKPTRRRSVIKQMEMPAFFAALEKVRARKDEPTAPMICDFLEFLLFTGLRKSEAASLRWDDLDLKGKTLTITDTKNSQPHVLPLTDYIIKILDRRKKEAGDSQWVFPSQSLKGKAHSTHISEPRYIAELIEEESGLKFITHDLRRTFISTCERLDLSYYAMKKLVNHKMGGDVTAGYIVQEPERLREPMQKITDYFIKVRVPMNKPVMKYNAA